MTISVLVLFHAVPLLLGLVFLHLLFSGMLVFRQPKTVCNYHFNNSRQKKMYSN